MTARERREEIINLLLREKLPLKGTDLADRFNVTRQIIVKDIAILRAQGHNIIATPEGYIFNNIKENRIKAIIAVNHNDEEMIKELEIVIKYGGIIEDVIVEHSVYGEIKATLMIKNLNDLNKFKEAIYNTDMKPLSILTNGVHLHTISANSIDDMDLIKADLKKNGFIL